MAAQIVSYDFGHHNRDLLGSSSRVLEGGGWKDQSTIMILPAGKQVSSVAALSWMNLIPAPNTKFYRFLAMDMEVGEAYTAAISNILAHPDLSNWKYILTVEHDNILPPTGMLDLYKAMDAHPEYSAIGGLYWTKGEGGLPQIWGDPTDPTINFRPRVPQAGKIIECCGTGMGFTLFRLSMFKDKRIERPWFETIADHRGLGTQDLTFWTKARPFGYRAAIHCGVLVGHIDLNDGRIW